jgi:hypothetical protein
MLFYLAVRWGAPSPLATPAVNPYHLEFSALEIWSNAQRYLAWLLSGMLPIPDGWSARHRLGVSLFGLVSLAAWIGILLLSPAGRRELRMALLLMTWFGLTLLPVIFVVEHPYRYYLLYGLPAAAAILVRAVLCAARGLPGGPLPGRILLVLLLLAGAAYGGHVLRVWDGQGLYQPFVEGSNMLVRKGITAKLARKAVLRACPNPEPGTVFVFAGIETSAFRGRQGLSTWYGCDDTLRVYTLENLRKDERGIFIDPARLENEDVERRAAPYLERKKTFAFALDHRRLVRMPWDQMARFALPVEPARPEHPP